MCVLLTGCMGGGAVSSGTSYSPSSSTSVATSDVMRTGDKITIRLTGVPEGEYVIEVQLPASGDVTVPLLTRSFHAVGRNPADLATDISTAYKSEKIYTNPHVTVLPEERFVNVGGDVRSPSRVPYTSDLTLLSAINACGGFTEYAKRDSVRILRGQQVIVVNAAAAARTPGADPVLYAGDQIFVPRTIF